MEHSIPIRILENENNRRGDLFGRLMADLFVALGYEYPRLNVHKSGREVDLQAEHRLEPRRAVAECKATKNLVGGDEVNKFVGALDAEAGGRDDRPITGYFISLSGFKETAVVASLLSRVDFPPPGGARSARRSRSGSGGGPGSSRSPARRVGSLPTQRLTRSSVVRSRGLTAVEVLLMTWNVEGHEPLREDEAGSKKAVAASVRSRLSPWQTERATNCALPSRPASSRTY